MPDYSGSSEQTMTWERPGEPTTVLDSLVAGMRDCGGTIRRLDDRDAELEAGSQARYRLLGVLTPV